MAWTVYQTLIALLMVITGSINTISTKWADMTESEGRPNGNKTMHSFNHPFVQSAGMFLGEITCLLAFMIIRSYFKKVKKVEDTELPEMVRSDKFNRFIFFIPALLDMTATTTMYIGLNMTYASSFQMLRGALIVFTGILTITVLKRKLMVFQWLGIFVIIVGLAVVGSNDFLKKTDSNSEFGAGSMITGDVLIVLAQILTAFQMIVEEKFLRGKNIAPLQAVGYEGLFGFIIASLLLIPLFYIKVMKDGVWTPIEDPYDAYLQIINNWKTALAICGNVVSIAFFNFAGISVTKEISATTRTVLDSIRTLVVWLFFLSIGHEEYSTLQLFGFILLVTGIMIHNDVLIRPYLISRGYIGEDRYNIINGPNGNKSPSTAQEEEEEEEGDE